MRTSRILAIILASVASINAFAQTDIKPAQPKMLTIMDPAPSFPTDGWIKGNPITNFEKGKVYVVEFWATWCGPCISAMPHLSELADKWRGKIEMISVNTWDYAKSADGAESVATHKQRVTDWVKLNDSKMRYNLAFDDDKDTISTTWMRAAGRNGIPCAFIVKDGKINWIGHPMSMDKPLEEIYSGTFDANAFKVKFQEEQEAQLKAAEAQKKVMAMIKDGNMTAIEEYINGAKSKAQAVSTVVSNGARSNPEMAFAVFKKYVGKVDGIDPMSWCAQAMALSGSKSLTGASKDELLKISSECAEMMKENKSIGFTYHARVIYNHGDKEAALKWIEKAKAELVNIKDEKSRESILKFIESTANSFK